MNFFQFHDEPETPRRETAEEIRARYEPEPVPRYERVPADDGPSLAEQRKAYKAEQKAGGIEARLWANLSAWQERHKAFVQRTLELFAGTIGEKLTEEKAALRRALAEHQATTQQELRDHIDAELSAAVKDVRETHGDLNRQAERLAQKSADRANAELRVEIRELRRELAELRAERANVRALR